jgi:hypothetical protein
MDGYSFCMVKHVTVVLSDPINIFYIYNEITPTIS